MRIIGDNSCPLNHSLATPEMTTNPVEQLIAELTHSLSDEVAERPHHRTVMITRRQLRAAISLAHLYLAAREKVIVHNGDHPALSSCATPLSEVFGDSLVDAERKVTQWQNPAVQP